MEETPREILPLQNVAETPSSFTYNWKAGVGVLLALGIIAVLVFSLSGAGRGTPRGVAEETYTLVRDKISKSAAIVLALPKGTTITPVEAAEKVKFEPAVDGKWAVGGNAQELFFEPSKKLTEGNYYTVSLQTADGVLSKDFLVDDDPKILAIFPRAKSEAPENSEITIVFSRPMVPLTTLDALDERDIPVEITPLTKGKFKWISTRNLQFIPETHLVRSATYTVTVKDGLTSVDGLPVKGITHTFTTRPLRYTDQIPGVDMTVSSFQEKLNTIMNVDSLPPPLSDAGPAFPVTSQQLLYNQPFTISFNQPVDIERTKGQISVKQNGKNIPLIFEYGKRALYNEGSRSEKEYIDKSVISISNALDRNGRARFWDFNTSYTVAIQKAYPTDGDIVLTAGRSFAFNVSEVISGITAESDRSSHVTPEMFDPKGMLIVRFYEEINKDASSFSAPHVKAIKYQEKCKLDDIGNQIYVDGKCVVEPDRTSISITFDSDAFVNGQAFDLTIKKVVNSAGMSLLPQPVNYPVVIFPKLSIRKTSPENGTTGAVLTNLVLCSNTPIKMPEEKDFYDKVKSVLTIGKWNWNESYRVDGSSTTGPCVTGEFLTTIRYGLIPESAYTLNLSLQDDFGQEAKKSLSFSSGKIAEMYRRITPLQKAYNVTSPERTKLVFGIENLEYVNVHICETDALTMMKYLDRESAPKVMLAGEQLSCIKGWTKRVELPKRYWTVNFFEFNLADYVPNPLGHYVVSLSHPEYRQAIYDYRTGKNTPGVLVYEHSLLTVTRLAVQEKKVESDEFMPDVYPPLTTKVQLASKGNLYWVTEFGTLAPVVGADVTVYQKGGIWASGGKTDAEGIARTPVAHTATAAIVTAGKDSAIVTGETDKFQWAQSLASAQKTYIYSDRPIYRPTEDVFIKGLYRIGYDGTYEIVRDRKADIVVYDSRGEKVTEGEADISESGTFTFKLTLGKTAPLGMYRVEALGGYGYFEVQEYVPSAFKVDVTSSKEEYIAGETMNLGIDGAYYFGVPLEKGDTVEYSMLAQDYYFDRYSDGWFEFGKGWYYGGGGGYYDRFLLRGKTVLNEKGKATITQSLDFKKFFPETEQDEGSADRSKIFTVNITVKNKQGQSVSSRKSLIVHKGAIYLGTNLERRYFGAGEQNKILLKSVDTTGKGVGASGITATISRVTWESYKRQEVDGRFYYQSTQKKEPVKTIRMSTNSSGDGTEAFSLDTAGQYELEVKGEDRAGNRVVSLLDFYVYGAGVVSVKPTNNETLELAVDKNKLKVGDVANVVIKSPFEKGKALVTIERGRIFEYQIVDVNQSLINIGIPIKEEYLPNVYFSVVLLSPRPEIKYGQVQFLISSAEKELFISVHSDKKNYLPGEKVRLSIEAKDSSGKPSQSEVSVAVADMSVLALKGNPKKDPVSFFYAGFPLGVATASNIKNILYEAEVPKGTKGGGGGEDLAKKKRGDFRSTALWQGVVQTDLDGKAEVAFTLPDNLTTWQSEVVGITKDTKVGVGYSELVARKEVMVTPLKPRFIVPGDTFKLGAKVFNQSDQLIRFNIKLESATLILPSVKNAFEKINPGESVAVYFDAKAPETTEKGSHLFTISAEGGDLLDSVEDKIAITKNDTYESVATSFSTSKEKAKEYVFLPANVVPDKGTLTITANSTLALYLTDALNYLISFPYGCSEQIASKLSAIAVIKRSYVAKNDLATFEKMRVELDGQSYSPDDLINIGLSRIYSNQTPEGGFTYYQGTPSNYYLTVHVLNTLLDLQKAGYAVKSEVRQLAARFIANGALYDDVYRKDQDLVVLAAYALERSSDVSGVVNPLYRKVVEIANTKKFVRETGSNLSLSYLALLLSSGNYSIALRDEVLSALENRLTIDSRGAFLKTGDRNVLYGYYETPIKDTAMLLRVWSSAKKDHELTDKVLRWLQKSRSKDGSWGSTNNTLSAVEALTDYMEWKKEADSKFELSILLDGVEKSKFAFNKGVKAPTTSLVIPIADLEKAKMHTIDFVKKNLNALANTFYYDLSLTYFLPINSVPARDEGFVVERNLYALSDEKMERPLSEAKVGEVLKGVLRIMVPKERRFVAVEDFIPAGMELVNFKLDTEDQSLQNAESQYKVTGTMSGGGGKLVAVFGMGGAEDLPDEAYNEVVATRQRLYADFEESHDDRLFLFKENLSAGVYEYTYFIRALVPGLFHHLPAVASELYFPENFGRTKGEYFTVTQ